MDTTTLLIVLTIIFAFYAAWSIGANDVANAMATSVGSGALTLGMAVVVAAVLEFSGAFFVGTHVSETVRKGIVDPAIFTDRPQDFVLGMLAALLAAGVWLQVASFKGWPVSTTHSIVGAVIGFGLLVGGVEAIKWGKVTSIVMSWVISPLLSGVISFLIFTQIRRRIFQALDPVQAALKATPLITFVVFAILTLTMVFKGLKNLHLDLPLPQALGIACLVGLLAALGSKFLVSGIKTGGNDDRSKEFQSPEVLARLTKTVKHLERARVAARGDLEGNITKLIDETQAMAAKIEEKIELHPESDEHRMIEKIFIYLQILSACFVAFAHGANDVANSIGPAAAAYSVLKTGVVGMNAPVPIWLLGLGGFGIVVGLATWGWRVIETVGKKITELTPTRGFSAEFGAATTIVVASKLGLPISTTHTLVGAVLGVGLARGLQALNLGVVRTIVASWIMTLPTGAALTVVFYYALRAVFGAG